jgi:hypothetical protein
MMALVHRGDVVQQVLSTTLHPALRHAVLPLSNEVRVGLILNPQARRMLGHLEVQDAPPGDGLWRDDDERLLPSRPESTRRKPEKLVGWILVCSD